MLDRVAAAVRELAPELGLDPALVRVVSVEDGIASVALGEACASCPASIPLLVAQLEAGIKERVPEVEILEVLS